MDSNLYFQLVACTLSQNMHSISLGPIFTCAPLLTGALLDLGFVPPGCCNHSGYSPYLGKSCFITFLPVRRDICLGISPRTLPGAPCQYSCRHIWHLCIPVSSSWPNTAWPWSPFPAVFYEATSSRSWKKKTRLVLIYPKLVWCQGTVMLFPSYRQTWHGPESLNMVLSFCPLAVVDQRLQLSLPGLGLVVLSAVLI